MIGQASKALEVCDEAEETIESNKPRGEPDLKLNVEMLTEKLIHGEQLPTRTIYLMNKAAILLS